MADGARLRAGVGFGHRGPPRHRPRRGHHLHGTDGGRLLGLLPRDHARAGEDRRPDVRRRLQQIDRAIVNPCSFPSSSAPCSSPAPRPGSPSPRTRAMSFPGRRRLRPLSAGGRDLDSRQRPLEQRDQGGAGPGPDRRRRRRPRPVQRGEMESRRTTSARVATTAAFGCLALGAGRVRPDPLRARPR